MNDEFQIKCDIIRQINNRKRDCFLSGGFLESMSTMALETIWDNEHRIEEIMINHTRQKDNIEKIRKLAEADENIRTRVERMLDGIGAKRLEDLGIFSEQILKLVIETQGEVK